MTAARAASIAPSLADIQAGRAPATPIDNTAFAPDAGAGTAPDFSAILTLHAGKLNTLPAIDKPLQDGRDARLFPGVTLEFFTLGQLLVPVQRGEMVRETARTSTPSYWRVIPQIGRVWHDGADGGWSRAAFPVMLVNDTENHAQQGLALFAYRGADVTPLQYQFVQQSAPYLLGQHFVAWGSTTVTAIPGHASALPERRAAAQRELSERLPAKPWDDLVRQVAKGALDGFGGPLNPRYLILAALLRDGTLYYQPAPTPYGPYPYPLEMRFGVRSVMKSVGVPLSLLRLAQTYGPWVLTLKIGDYVANLDPKWKTIRFIDAANMASGFGGTGSVKTQPNDIMDGYLDGNYDAWYTAHSHADKLARINADLKPYPWLPGTVMRYRDQDFYLLGAALDAFLKSVRGPQADIWEMLKSEVFAPIGIAQAPAVRTREHGGKVGQVWFNAGYYPSLDDLAKIALLYQSQGEHAGVQLLNRRLTIDLLAARGALQKDGDFSVARVLPENAPITTEFYQMGIHFLPYVGSASRRRLDLPSMNGFGENEVTMYPNGMVSLILGNAATFKPGDQVKSDKGPLTLRAVDRLAPF